MPPRSKGNNHAKKKALSRQQSAVKPEMPAEKLNTGSYFQPSLRRKKEHLE
jgi:hypothetical protein